MCAGHGCEHCEDGYFKLTECADKYVGEMWSAIKYASLADKHLPQTGGTANQSVWFINLWVAFSNDKAKIEREQLKQWQQA